MSKHEEASREILELSHGIEVNHQIKRISAILSKHYDTQKRPDNWELCKKDISGGLGYFMYIGDNCCGNPDTPVEPKLEAGMWVDFKNLDGRPPMFLVNAKKCKFIYLDGTRGQSPPLTPHTFTDPDLALLNSSKVEYELTVEDDGRAFISQRYEHDSVDNIYYPTAHLAIESAFNANLYEAHFKSNVLKGMVKS